MQGEDSGHKWQVIVQEVVKMQLSHCYPTMLVVDTTELRKLVQVRFQGKAGACLPGEGQPCCCRAHFQHHLGGLGHQQAAATAAGCLEGISQHCQLLPTQSTCNHTQFTYLLRTSCLTCA